MGSSSWSSDAFRSYSATRGRSVTLDGYSTTQNMFTENYLNDDLDPKGVIRECCDSEEHPNTIPVIIALDVTGSMGSACKKVAQSLNKIMENLYGSYKDIEFLIMGIGDLSYDVAPIQVSQYESDIRIAEQTDKIYFEGGGGGNGFESYTASWFFGLYRTRLDCWKRGKKGIIITLGDEPLNPYLPKNQIYEVLGDAEGNILSEFSDKQFQTPTLYEKAKEKFDIFHIAVDDSHDAYHYYAPEIENSFGKLLGNRFKVSSLNHLPDTISGCIAEAIDTSSNTVSVLTNSEDILTTTPETEIPTISW